MDRTSTVLLGLALPFLTLAQSAFQQQYSRDEADIPYGGAAHCLLATPDGFILGAQAPGSLYGVSLTITDASGTLISTRTYDMSLDGFGQGSITAMAQLPGGDLIVAGTDPELFFARIGSDGVVAWAKHVAGTYNFATDIVITADGNFLLTGKRQGNAFDAFVINGAPDGTVLWAKNYDTGSEFSEFFTSLVVTPDGGCLAYGYWNYNLNYMDLLVVKLDASGAVEWSKLYGNSDVNTFLMSDRIRATSDGNYTLSAAATTFGSQTWEPVLFKIDPLGTVLWSNKWNAFESTSTLAVSNLSIRHEVMPDQSLMVMVGSVGYPSNSIQVVHADANGVPLTSNHLRNVSLIETATDMVLLPDGGMAITGYNSTGTYIPSSFLFRTDGTGHTPCNDSSSTATVTAFALPSSDVSLTATPSTFIYQDLTAATALVVLDGQNICSSIGIAENRMASTHTLSICPNPASDNMQVMLNGPASTSSSQLQVIDITGAVVRTVAVNNRTSVVLDRGSLVSGLYLVRWNCAEGRPAEMKLMVD